MHVFPHEIINEGTVIPCFDNEIRKFAHLLEREADFPQINLTMIQRGESRRMTFQSKTHITQLFKIFDPHLRHTGTEMSPDTYEAIRFQAVERFPHRSATYSDLTGEHFRHQ